MKVGNIITSLLCLSISQISVAGLGDKSAEIEGDRKIVNGKTIVTGDSKTNCYTIQEISTDGVHVKEFVNRATDTVFMIATNSRISIGIQPLLGKVNFVEYQAALRNSSSSHKIVSRHRKRIAVENDKIKIRIEDRPLIHRSLLILKSATPTCAGNPESLL